MTYDDCEPFRPALSRGLCRFLAGLATVAFGLTGPAGLTHGKAMVNDSLVRICIGESWIEIPLSDLPGGEFPDEEPGNHACHAACLNARKRGPAALGADDPEAD